MESSCQSIVDQHHHRAEQKKRELPDNKNASKSNGITNALCPPPSAMGVTNNKDLLDAVEFDEQVTLRALSRSPHPYHRHQAEIPSDFDRLALPPDGHGGGPAALAAAHKTRNGQLSPIRLTAFSKESTPISDSGTEADDEHFLRGLPAPRTKLHKGLRGRNEILSGTATPVSASIAEEQNQPLLGRDATPSKATVKGTLLSPLRRYRNLVRRLTEAGILALLSAFVTKNRHVAPIYNEWKQGMRKYDS